jgi:hypothetical protein
MCDYSLHHVSSRPARVADKLVTTELAKSSTRGFAAVGELGTKLVIHDSPPGMAVCLLPGTELAFDDDVEYDRAFSFLGKARVNHKVASFRQIDVKDPHVHHDALEFPDGQVLKITQLVPGQTATVLQLPIATHQHDHVEPTVTRVTSRVTLNRVAAGSGVASILMPSVGSVMLWQAVSRKAHKLTAAFAQPFRRQPATVEADRIEADLDTGMLDATLSKAPATQKPEKVGVRAAA